MITRRITATEVAAAARNVAASIYIRLSHTVVGDHLPEQRLYGASCGGVSAAFAVSAALEEHDIQSCVVDDFRKADFVIDDFADVEAARVRFVQPFYALYDARKEYECLVLPWEPERNVPPASTEEDIVLRTLEAIGEDTTREGLADTPRRVVKAWKTWFSGYGQDPADVIKVFADGAEGADEMILETDIPVYSFCEHHIAPIFGVAHIAYIPDGKVLGLSKLSRVVDIFSRRLQVQERLTTQIASTLEENLRPKGVGVVLQCRHLCMESRGICRPGIVTTTSALRGAIKDEHDTRAEFLSLVNMAKSRHSHIL